MFHSEKASGSPAEDFRRFPRDTRRRQPKRLGGGTQEPEEAGWPASGAPGEEAEMRYHFKGVDPPLELLFPSPSAVGEVSVSRLFFPRGRHLAPTASVSSLFSLLVPSAISSTYRRRKWSLSFPPPLTFQSQPP